MTDGNGGTPMERMKEGRKAEDASLNVPSFSSFPHI